MSRRSSSHNPTSSEERSSWGSVAFSAASATPASHNVSAGSADSGEGGGSYGGGSGAGGTAESDRDSSPVPESASSPMPCAPRSLSGTVAAPDAAELAGVSVVAGGAGGAGTAGLSGASGSVCAAIDLERAHNSNSLTIITTARTISSHQYHSMSAASKPRAVWSSRPTLERSQTSVLTNDNPADQWRQPDDSVYAMSHTWIDITDDAPFGAATLPYGVFSTEGEEPRIGVAVGKYVIDLAPIAANENLDGAHMFAVPSLNPFMSLGRRAWEAVRGWLVELVTHDANSEVVEPHLVPADSVTMHMPFAVADFVDFYASRHHAENLGKIFRPDSPALPAAWLHLPIGYHGRSGTVVPSGTDIRRPHGLRRSGDDVTHGPSQRLDIEAEIGFVVGTSSGLGRPVPVDRFTDHVFGMVLVNDWSARDIQAFEYVPLGPFLGKSFATSISPWVVPLAALESARVDPPARDPGPVDYLRDAEPWGLDLELAVTWNGTTVSRPPFKDMYWTPAQQLAHMTANGASLRTGDLFASGTVSGPGRDQRGSFLEMSWNGTEPVTLDDGTSRTFLEDGDAVTISATAPGPDGSRIALGTVSGRIVE